MADLESRVVEETLPNGMRVIVLPRHQSPTVSLSMQFRVGAAQETEGASGLAHLLEHMMFKGTRTLGTRDWAAERPLLERIEAIVDDLDAERRRGAGGDAAKLAALEARLAEAQQAARALVVKDEIDAIYTANGSQDFNASTGVDVTTYKISLPANRLPLWARIESERLREPVMREFYSEREVVREERRQSYENDPSRKLMELFFASAFIAHPYRRPVIGWDGDVRFLRAATAERFFRTWYAPNNTVLAAVGDVDPPAFLALVRAAFGPIPAQPLPAETATPEPEQGGERRVTLLSDARPELLIGFHKPTLPTFEDYVFDLDRRAARRRPHLAAVPAPRRGETGRRERLHGQRLPRRPLREPFHDHGHARARRTPRPRSRPRSTPSWRGSPPSRRPRRSSRG